MCEHARFSILVCGETSLSRLISRWQDELFFFGAKIESKFFLIFNFEFLIFVDFRNLDRLDRIIMNKIIQLL